MMLGITPIYIIALEFTTINIMTISTIAPSMMTLGLMTKCNDT